MKKEHLIYVLVFAIVGLLQSCKEEIDTSDRYTFKQHTVASFLEKHDSLFSEYYRLLGEVQISRRSASTVLQLMSARGNYTVFAPNNKAIQNYLDTLTAKGIINEPTWDGFPNKDVLDSIRKVIVYNSILDGRDDNSHVYQTSSFPSKNGAELEVANLNDRKLTYCYSEAHPDSMFIDASLDPKTKAVIGGAAISGVNRDIPVINGYIHEVEAVIAPSDIPVGDLLKEMMDLGDKRLSIMAEAILACGLKDTLSRIRDEVYENRYLAGELENVTSSQSIGTGYLPEHRKYGFTIFAEDNDFWVNELHKDAADITPKDIKEWVIKNKFYPNAKTDDNYSDSTNVLNQFITYHILPVRIPVSKLVIHYNEKGYYYKPANNPHTIPVWEIYTTMGERRLQKESISIGSPRWTMVGTERISRRRAMRTKRASW